jgi:D-psicose/D-tagatose/L-ribulose 3-epimerase
MKLSVSSLAFGKEEFLEFMPRFAHFGLNGFELAPTQLLQDFDSLTQSDFKAFRRKLKDTGAEVSGIQSLLFGHPEYQVFEKSTWHPMIERLTRMFEFGSSVGAEVAVFGSPKNRVKGSISKENADEIFVDFLEVLIPRLQENNIVLTLEPNAPNYGTDFLTTYSDVVNLAERIQSAFVRPQIDTGCMMMVEEDICASFETHRPDHIHLSMPNLAPLPGSFDFHEFLKIATLSKYPGWLVIEMLSDSKKSNSTERTLYWLQEQMRNFDCG